ncbi:MAG: hypothetical protein BSOLF_0457 [Candidatus Carbobacillus altaicus]|uniref:Uncharacterized protein n=1 Tax=Candidatus Carbonibacillus altaicus TaxID=2163959 RepID=A0A2R6Y5J4_9BACL|nr:MAG: hypothetical protein BSOLF_0457 [Candidatus Carbobacillus altaicus]
MFDLKVIRNSLVLIFISLLIALLWSLRASSARLAVWVDQLGKSF